MPYQCKITLVMDSFRNASLIDYIAIPKYAAFDWGVFRYSVNITIITPKGSATEEYAKSNNIPYDNY